MIPITKSLQITLDDGKHTKRTVHRKQLPITAAYACTDYRSQGQTISAALIDIATPPTGSLSMFNLYVALSRARGRDSIRLLRDFEDRLFLSPQLGELTTEDKHLNTQTLRWWSTMTDRP